SWPLFVTEAEARAGGRIRIGYAAAVSVLPEASALTVSLDGVGLGTGPVVGGHGPQEITVEVPPNRLAPGFNALGVAVR
ncbi:cellulose biosynthesis cyclic di-GMP-binding regulatory protein BcsB, partial [Bacillus safensis]|uniref:cellulose biosynthesis cyclic di-GMP-binding regulatory protein BcsB n=1 Tax=Bacillus safensis TaxID=561879 RepID=UPI001FFA64AD